MARQTGIIKLKGTIGDLAREKGGCFKNCK